jgi:hypothetical protein
MGDVWVIAHARVFSVTVVAEEFPSTGKKPKIPDVCKAQDRVHQDDRLLEGDRLQGKMTLSEWSGWDLNPHAFGGRFRGALGRMRRESPLRLPIPPPDLKEITIPLRLALRPSNWWGTSGLQKFEHEQLTSFADDRSGIVTVMPNSNNRPIMALPPLE